MKILFFVICFILSSSVHANTRDGLVGWWKFDSSSTAFDSSWRGNVGTITGTNFFTNCIRLNCFNFNGTSDLVDISNQSDFNFTPTSTITLSAWIIIPSSDNSNRGIIGKTNTTGFHQGYHFQIDQVDNVLDFGMNGADSSTIFRQSSLNIKDSNWHHALVTYDGSATVAGIKIYVDSVETSYLGGNNFFFTTSTDISNSINLNIGKVVISLDMFFLGNIDDVRIYNRVLTAQEIKDLYNSGTRLNYAPGT